MKQYDYKKYRLTHTLSFARFCVALAVLLVWSVLQPSLSATLVNVAIGILVGRGIK